jgi:hypothetical protein
MMLSILWTVGEDSVAVVRWQPARHEGTLLFGALHHSLQQQ